MINDKLTFPKKEKLCSNKQIEELFAKGKSFVTYPVRVVYIIRDENDLGKQFASVLISVSKKRFKRANKRNRVKRLIREAYRLNKLELQETLVLKNKSIDIAFIYLKDTLPEYSEMKESVTKAIRLLSERVGEVNK